MAEKPIIDPQSENSLGSSAVSIPGSLLTLEHRFSIQNLVQIWD